MTSQNIPAPAINALQHHQAAKAEYLQQQERLTILAERTDRYQKTAAAALEQAHGDGQKWREQLRKNDGELTKEIQKLRQDALAAEQLANEYQLMADEVAQELEMARFAIDPIRGEYQRTQQKACRTYARTKQAAALQNLLTTEEGQEFLRVFGMTGMIPEKGAIRHAEQPPMHTARHLETAESELGARLIQILDECKTIVPCHTLDGELWNDLKIVKRHPAEEHPKELRESPVRKKRRKAEIDAIRQQKSA